LADRKTNVSSAIGSDTAPICITPDTVLVVVPVYNHSATLRQVVERVLAHHTRVLVVDDGSSDMEPKISVSHPLYGLEVALVRHNNNMGKGQAILTAAAWAKQHSMTHIITIDADAQHFPEDISKFVAGILETPLAILVGARDMNCPNVPGSSRFGRAFSNFWFKVQTEQKISDSQCGFRAYPLLLFDCLRLEELHYSFEIEIIVRAAWAGFMVKDVPVGVYYPPAVERVSHFKPLKDNLRISWLNTRLTVRAIMPVPHKKYVSDGKGHISILRPIQSLHHLLVQNETPLKLALSGALGVFLGTLPLIGLHSISIILLAGHARLSKIMGLATSQLCMPPFVPALCIEVGHYVLHGKVLTELSVQTLWTEAFDRFAEWVLGSLVLAPLLALGIGGVCYALAKSVQLGLLASSETGGQP
jgi:Glycosyltransferases involved in cell wall biogenesis